MNIQQQACEAADYIRSRARLRPTVGLIVGTALGDLVQEVSDGESISFEEVPFVQQSTVKSHDGKFVLGTLAGTQVILMSGRLHYYEGYSPTDVAFPINVMKELGVHTLVVTNASGAINESYRTGEIMLIEDHINLAGVNPLRGPDTSMGPRYPDLTDAYSPRLRQIAHSAAHAENIKLQEGVYAWTLGPSLESPAEIRALRALGGDAVGMSTVPEVIVARYLGIEVLGCACLTNMAAGMTTEDEFANDYIANNGANAAKNLSKVLIRLMDELSREQLAVQ